MKYAEISAKVVDFFLNYGIDVTSWHVPIVYFAIATPFIAFAYLIAYLITDNKEHSKVSTYLFVFSSLFIFLAYFTGNAKVLDTNLLSSSAQSALNTHSKHAIILVALFGVLLIVKLVIKFVNKKWLRLGWGILFFITIVLISLQAKVGQSLVYKYAIGVNPTPETSIVKEFNEIDTDSSIDDFYSTEESKKRTVESVAKEIPDSTVNSLNY